ncbi:hypothetical protein HMPREF0731_3987 [Pseudoroseomonas cervicalis ATCC 49957]|uniref:Uncharacterized protein n=1 Tax=Pseudoroseomonas cervicalis ATCC 49957 TaxID=525371 RepID=D5RSC5_9PROT|nr:hypothetical protein HMPREF0731_3987 [Pseudoroseomonas cervicalis ATCC 49957]
METFFAAARKTLLRDESCLAQPPLFVWRCSGWRVQGTLSPAGGV